jgi:hypothetical protein
MISLQPKFSKRFKTPMKRWICRMTASKDFELFSRGTRKLFRLTSVGFKQKGQHSRSHRHKDGHSELQDHSTLPQFKTNLQR